MAEKILYNAIKCKNCGKIIESKYKNDLQICDCGQVSVSGGLIVLKRTFKGDRGDYEDLSVIQRNNE